MILEPELVEVYDDTALRTWNQKLMMYTRGLRFRAPSSFLENLDGGPTQASSEKSHLGQWKVVYRTWG